MNKLKSLAKMLPFGSEERHALLKIASDIEGQVDHKKSITLMRFLSSVANRLDVGKHIYIVGGAVRNFIIGHAIKDVDIVVDSIALGGKKDSEWFARQVARAIPTVTDITTNQYGIAIVSVKGPWEIDGSDLSHEVIEIANARSESYVGKEGKGYKPTEVKPATIKEDTFRREFSFNTLLWRLADVADGPDKAEIIDITGFGRKHLEERLIKTPLDPDKTFSDDPTRLLRALKFAIKYDFSIPEDVVDSIRRNAHKLKDMPWNAVGKILVNDILLTPKARESISLMSDLGILDVLKEMVVEDKSFASFMTGQIGNGDVQLNLDLADAGFMMKTSVMFLTQDQRERFREITAEMSEKESQDLLDALRVPPIDNEAIISQFNLKSRDRAILAPSAREIILARPELIKHKDELQSRVTDLVRSRIV